jgi:hypothetical protein
MLIETIDNDILRFREKNEKSSGSARVGGERTHAKRGRKGGLTIKPRSPVLEALITILSPMGQRGF